MKCLMCEDFSFNVICKNCDSLLKLSPQKRFYADGFAVFSFYEYQSIEFLLKSKYHLIGSRIYKFLAKKAWAYFSGTNADFGGVYGIGIDDRVSSFYSHSGVIVKEFAKSFTPLFGALKAKGDIHYAGKSLKYRQNHKKDFVYSGKRDISAVLIDDIITSGASIDEARECLESNGVRVLFALVLSDARF
ncbi:phosphoribosyltransferase [Helicobacter sp. 23-1045]